MVAAALLAPALLAALDRRLTATQLTATLLTNVLLTAARLTDALLTSARLAAARLAGAGLAGARLAGLTAALRLVLAGPAATPAVRPLDVAGVLSRRPIARTCLLGGNRLTSNSLTSGGLPRAHLVGDRRCRAELCRGGGRGTEAAPPAIPDA
jgi:uncharacterized protein YjbI with pentapeptide repeats